MSDKKFDGKKSDAVVEKLPRGAARMSVLLDIIKQADEAEDYYYGMYFRYRYACEACFHDDPSKVLPIAAEFADIYEKHSAVLPNEAGAEMYVMIMQMAIDPIVNLPQIPIKQWEKLMEQMHMQNQ